MVKRKIVFRQKKRQNRFSMVLVMIAVLMVLVVVSLRSVDLKRKQEYYGGAQIEQLERQIEEETQRTAEIEEYEKYTKTRKYVEEVAKDKLGLVYEGEIIFKPEE